MARSHYAILLAFLSFVCGCDHKFKDTQNCRVGSSLALKYMNQSKITPMTPGTFGSHLPQGHRVKLVPVQKKGDLTKWIQTIDGIPVYSTVITTRGDEHGRIVRKEGFLAEPKLLLDLDPTPKVSAKEAIEILKIHWHHIGLEKVDWRVDEPKLYVLPRETRILAWKASYYVDWKNDVIPEQGYGTVPAYVVGKCTFQGYGTVPAYVVGLVNAHTGAVEETWNNLQDIAVKAIVGNDKVGKAYHTIDVERKDEWCWHVDDQKKIEVFTMENKLFLTNKTRSSFICDRATTKDFDGHSFTGGFSPRNEAFLHASRFVDLWRELVGWEIQPYRTSSSFLELYTHYGYNVEDARFNGFFFIFGDGKNRYYPLTSLDVVCHEIGHAVTLWKGGKMEYWKESGGMNEAYSDILGETCDMHYKKRDDYLIGEDITRKGTGAALRDMCNPAKFGGLDHYKQYNDSIDVHYTSGIYNKAWCTLSKSKGWNYIKAFQVFTDANLMYWNERITMHCGACSVESAAKDRKLNAKFVSAAFAKVGVFCSRCSKI